MFFVAGPIAYRTNHDAPLQAGEEVPPHDHNFDHTTQILMGEAEITLALGTHVEKVVLRAGMPAINVPAAAMHSIRALVDHTIYQCAYPHRLPDGAIVGRYTGYLDAYS